MTVGFTSVLAHFRHFRPRSQYRELGKTRICRYLACWMVGLWPRPSWL